MGSTALHRDKGQTTAQFFTAELLFPHQRIVASNTRDGVFYAAVQDDQEGRTFGLVVLYSWHSGEWNFSYKPMDEGMGPYVYDASAAVLDALTPTDSDTANKWRDKCRERIAARASRPKVKPGDVVTFAHPFSFSNGDRLDRFVYEGGSRFRGAFGTGSYGAVYTITRWRDRQYSIERGNA